MDETRKYCFWWQDSLISDTQINGVRVTFFVFVLFFLEKVT